MAPMKAGWLPVESAPCGAVGRQSRPFGWCPESPHAAMLGLLRRPVCAAPSLTSCGLSGHHATPL